jgi:hypothetical protein
MKELNITFSWNLDLLLDGGKDKSCQDGGGWQVCGEWNLDVLLDGTKNNFGQDDNGRQLLGKRLRHLLNYLLSNPSWSSTKSCFEVVTS